ncbi:MAG: DNA alkylation repair protein [Nanoarchaeota archaeon]
MSHVNHLLSYMKSLSDNKRAVSSTRFFKTGKGDYGEGDKFLGLTVPQCRIIVKDYSSSTSLDDISVLLKSDFHEVRLVALLILVDKYEKSTLEAKPFIVDFYLSNTSRINNWDLVDSTAHKILGDYLLDKDRSILYKLAKSNNLWEKRISIVSTYTFIRNNDFFDALRISQILFSDNHDLIHKATGWMLREVGKKDEQALIIFLDKHYKTMPRTALRYSIERLSKKQKDHYMKK